MTDKQINHEQSSVIIDGVDVSGCECLIQDYQRANNIEGRYEHIKNVCELGERGAEYYNLICKDNPNCDYKQLKRKEQECERLKEGYSELTDIVSPYMDDFTGYNEELGGFDIVLCVKEFMEQLDQLKAYNNELKRANLHIENNREHKANKLNRIEKLILAYTTGYTDEFIQELLVILHEPEPVSFENKYLQTLAEIRNVLDTYYDDDWKATREIGKILQKISEVEE